MEDIQAFKESEFERVKSNLYNAKRKSFGSSDALAEWYIRQLESQNFCCYYCETSISDIKRLIDAGLLRTRRVRGEGVRGPVLEIDKNDDFYTPDGCVLSCYYCNNDKSYTSTQNDYKKYFGKNRRVYFDSLIKQLNSLD